MNNTLFECISTNFILKKILHRLFMDTFINEPVMNKIINGLKFDKNMFFQLMELLVNDSVLHDTVKSFIMNEKAYEAFVDR